MSIADDDLINDSPINDDVIAEIVRGIREKRGNVWRKGMSVAQYVEILTADLRDNPICQVAEAGMRKALDAGDTHGALINGFFFGYLHGQIRGCAMVDGFAQKGRKGGPNPKLTAEDVDFAQKIVDDYCNRNARNSFWGGCKRAVRELQDERKKKIGPKALREHLKDPTLDSGRN